MSDRETKEKKITVLAVRPSGIKERILAVICGHAVCMNLKKSYSQTSVDSEERYNWFKHKNTCVHVHNRETYPGS